MNDPRPEALLASCSHPSYCQEGSQSLQLCVIECGCQHPWRFAGDSSPCDGTQQIAEFVVEFVGGRHRLGNLFADEIAKVAAEPVNRDFDRTF